MRTSQLQHNTTLSIYKEPAKQLRATKIICTIGPKTQSVEGLKGLMQAGMNVARMNFSHGSHEYHKTTIDNVRKAAGELGLHIAIALDTKGPEIRCGLFTNGEAPIKKGQTITVTADPNAPEKEQGNNSKFYIDYANICKAVKVGGHIFIDDGILNLEIKEIFPDKNELLCIAHNNHLLTNRKGVNLPHAAVDLPAVSEKDKDDLAFGAREQVDMIFASFIRSGQQVHEVRAALGERGPKTMIISKIENHQGVDNIDEIIEASDGIMVARGDLGVEIPAEKVIIAQKLLISKCNAVGKPVICATQMLESMTTNPRPTRAEVSDVANAVFDGADCVMLSGETAKGSYPNEVVDYMAKICCEAQAAARDSVFFWSIKEMQKVPMGAEESICSSAVNSVLELEAKALIVLSNTGRSARLLAKYRPSCPIYCASEFTEVCRALCITRAVFPVFYDTQVNGADPDREKRVKLAIDEAKKDGNLKTGDLVVIVHADFKTKGFANQTRVVRVE
jgi:pyruvate kinase